MTQFGSYSQSIKILQELIQDYRAYPKRQIVLQVALEKLIKAEAREIAEFEHLLHEKIQSDADRENREPAATSCAFEGTQEDYNRITSEHDL